MFPFKVNGTQRQAAFVFVSIYPFLGSPKLCQLSLILDGDNLTHGTLPILLHAHVQSLSLDLGSSNEASSGYQSLGLH